jgi:hypothetical protein
MLGRYFGLGNIAPEAWCTLRLDAQMPFGMYHLLQIKGQTACGADMCGERNALDSSYRLDTNGRAMMVARRGWWCGLHRRDLNGSFSRLSRPIWSSSADGSGS